MSCHHRTMFSFSSRQDTVSLQCFTLLLAELSSLLKTPLIPVGFSGKYPTKSGALLTPGIKGKVYCYFTSAVQSLVGVQPRDQ